MKTLKYHENLVLISYTECLRIFICSILLGLWTLGKSLLLRVLKSTKYEWNTINNPPLCLVDSAFGQHSYMKIKVSGSSVNENGNFVLHVFESYRCTVHGVD